MVSRGSSVSAATPWIDTTSSSATTVSSFFKSFQNKFVTAHLNPARPKRNHVKNSWATSASFSIEFWTSHNGEFYFLIISKFIATHLAAHLNPTREKCPGHVGGFQHRISDEPQR